MPRITILLGSLSEAAGRWTVEALEGGAEGRSASWAYATETEARAQANRCLETGGDGWRELRV